MCSWTIYTACFRLPDRPRHHSHVDRRLALLPAWAIDDDDHHALRATAAQLRFVYRQCCDVLHGRRAYTELGEPLVTAWARIVEEGETIVTSRCT
jgi:hypothetical protein